MSKNDENYFIKSSDLPVGSLSTEQKAKLNRRGNELFNLGNITEASRIFLTTGYSDGLGRVGDYYMAKKEKLNALKYYKLANRQASVDLIISEIAELIRVII